MHLSLASNLHTFRVETSPCSEKTSPLEVWRPFVLTPRGPLGSHPGSQEVVVSGRNSYKYRFLHLLLYLGGFNPEVPSILLSIGTWGSCKLACPTIGLWLHPWLGCSLTCELSGHLSEHCYPEGLAFFSLLLPDLT